MNSYHRFQVFGLSLAFLLCFFASATAQEFDPKGKTFSAKEGQACKMMFDGV